MMEEQGYWGARLLGSTVIGSMGMGSMGMGSKVIGEVMGKSYRKHILNPGQTVAPN